MRPAAAAAVLVVLAAGAAWFWLRAPEVPAVSNYVQLTHDARRKSLIGTDGSRLYIAMGSGSGGSASQGIAEMSVTGSEPRKLAAVPSPDMFPVDLSPDGSELLVIDGQGAPPRGPLWSIPTSGGSPRKLGDMVAETASWSRDAGLLAYANRSELFLAKGDGTEPRKLLSVTGDIRDIQWSPDNAHLRFDTSPTAGGYGQQMMLEVSTQGKDVHQLLPGWHKPPDECCGRWTPDGQWFVFASKHQIWALPRRGRPFSAPKPVQLTSSPLLLSSPLPDKNGKKLFMVGQTDRGELTRYDLKSGQFTPYLGGTSVEYVNVSQDGQWAAFVTYPQGNLWRSRMDGTDRMQLTFPRCTR